MLIEKIKPCMSKYKQFIQRNCGRLIISVIIYLTFILWITLENLGLIHSQKTRLYGSVALVRFKTNGGSNVSVTMIHDHLADRWVSLPASHSNFSRISLSVG